VGEVIVLADTKSEGFEPSESEYRESTGYRQLRYVFETAGTYVIGLGVTDVRDRVFDSAVLIDGVVVTGLLPPPDPPVLEADEATTEEDVPVSVDVLANDLGPGGTEGVPLSVVEVTQGEHGSVAIADDGTLTYTPEANFNGTDAFSYVALDEQGGGTAEASVTVKVTPVNDVPQAKDDAAYTKPGTAVVIDVLANDVEVDGEPLSIVGKTDGENGSVEINVDDGTVTYTPKEDFEGEDEFTYTIEDGSETTATAKVVVTVAPKPPAENIGGFEDGLGAWIPIGDVSVQGAEFGEGPATGDQQAVLTTNGLDGGFIPGFALEKMLKLEPGSLVLDDGGGAGGGPYTGIFFPPQKMPAGSAMGQVVTVEAGAELTVDFNFLTDEQTPTEFGQDFAFLSVSGAGGSEVVVLADTVDSQFAPSESAFEASTGYQQATYTFAEAGTYVVGLGVIDAVNPFVDSALLVDDILVSGLVESPPLPADGSGWSGAVDGAMQGGPSPWWMG
jgi:hypothetical protein